MAAEQKLSEQYIEFQTKAPSVFHAAQAVCELFKKAGFSKIDFFAKEWKLSAGKGYYLVHPSQKAVIGFIKGSDSSAEKGFNIVASHLDSPVLHLKLRPVDKVFEYGQLYTQLHGGLIFRSWLDRPLQVAGMLYRHKKQKQKIAFDPENSLPAIESKLVASSHPIGVIPDLAIHFDREKNKFGDVNPETGMNAVIASLGQSAQDLKKQLFSHLGGDENWDGFDLALSPTTSCEIVGLDHSLLVGPRHDDLAMVFTTLAALCDVKKDKVRKTAVAAFFDSEETGSQTYCGAQSAFFRDCLEKIQASEDGQASSTGLAHSFVISADMAHAVHPGYADRHDARHRPMINAGMVLKYNSNDRYASNGYSAACFSALCASCEVPLQPFVAKQDGGCGSTIGPILASLLNCPTVDVGAPMWAMHSTAETMGVKDLFYAKTVFTHFFAAGKD